MPTYAFFAARDEQRRADQLNFAVATGANASAARAAAEFILGEPNALVGWNAIDLSAAPAVFVSGLPIAARSQSVWPIVDRGGSYMKGA
jgi:hypothetical protein